MRSRSFMFWALAIAIVFTTGSVFAGSIERGVESFTNGKSFLAEGRFKDALKAFALAAKHDPENQEYREKYTILRQVLKMRSSLDKETNQDKWLVTAQGLRRFYNTEKLYTEALSLDKKAHEKLNTPESAIQLAHSYLATDNSAEAITLLNTIGDKMPLEGSILLGIANARQGKVAEAQAIADKCKLDDKAGPDLAYNLACLFSLLGNDVAALQSLTRSFETTPPSKLDMLKDRAKCDVDLAKVTDKDGFEKSLTTKSKIKESSCSGGSSCGSCPSRTKCGSSTKSKSSK